jgi:hypothetical protein
VGPDTGYRRSAYAKIEKNGEELVIGFAAINKSKHFFRI